MQHMNSGDDAFEERVRATALTVEDTGADCIDDGRSQPLFMGATITGFEIALETPNRGTGHLVHQCHSGLESHRTTLPVVTDAEVDHHRMCKVEHALGGGVQGRCPVANLVLQAFGGME